MKTTNIRTFTHRLRKAFSAAPRPFIQWALALALTSSSMDAATLRWTGGHATSSEWGRPANWDLGVAPQDGDTLVFPSGAARLTNTNNLANLELVAIRFSGAAGGYTLSGNGVVLTNSITATNVAGINTIRLARLNLGKDLPFNAAQAGNTLIVESDIRLGGNDLLVNGPGRLELLGVISGNGNITKTNTGVLVVGGTSANTYVGEFKVDEGQVELSKTAGLAVTGMLTVGDGLGGSNVDVARNTQDNQVNKVTVKGSGLWELAGHTEEVSELTLAGGGDIQTGPAGLLRLGIGADVVVTPNPSPLGTASSISGRLELLLGGHTFSITDGLPSLSDGTELLIDADISGLGAITKTGTGDMQLAGHNTFVGLTKVEGGELRISTGDALGSTLSGTQILNNGSLQLQNNITVFSERLTLNSTGTTGLLNERPALNCVGNNAWDGEITLEQDTRIGVGTGGALDLSGVISGTFGILKEREGDLVYSGFQGNTYSGPTRVLEGSLTLSKGIFDNALKGSLEIGGDNITDPAATVVCSIASQLPQTTPVTVHKSGHWTIASEKIGSLAGSGNVVNNVLLRTGFDNADTLYSGVMSGNGTVFKFGTGTWTLQAANTFTGNTWIGEGNLMIQGSLTSPFVIVLNNGLLGGNGTVGNTLAGPQSLVAPGASPGRLGTQNFSLLPNSTLRMEINGTQPGAEHDQIKVQGLVDLGGANLDLKLGYVPAVGQKLVLIDNDGNDPVIDTFNGLPEGSIIRLNNLPFEITYTGGDGNDVVLEYNDSAVSVSQATVTAEGGNGNAIIDRNECNFLNIELRNERNLPLIVTRAVLDSLTPGVLVTQQEGDYAAFGPLETRINTTPFKISTMENFECGRTIQLQLTLSINGGTTFSLPVSLPSGTAGTLARYDQPLNVAIPDNGQATSTLTVSNAAPYIGKVTVGLHITHTAAGDLVLRLRSPHGTTVRLATQLGGAVDDYGAACNPLTQRTLFDDDATIKIAAATAPFVGVFVPEEELGKFVGEDPNGDWKLLIDDTVTGDTGILECWSLGIAPAECADGGGDCESCTPALAGNFDASSPVLTTYLAPSGDRSLCGVSNTCPVSITGPARRYGIHTLTETSSKTRCITIQAVAECGRNTGLIRAVAYAGSFDPANPCLNYLGDSGGLPFAAHANFSVELPANQNLVVVVYDQDGAGVCDRYTLEVHGLPCPAPVLTIRLGTAPNTVDLEWSTSYPGYQLKQRSTLDETTPPQIRDVTETPVIVNGVYRVTLPSTDPRRFFWLEKR